MLMILSIFQIVVCALLIILVLLQHGKGADVGASFGTGASQTIFGSRGTGNFLTHTTAVLAALFFLNCLFISYFIFDKHQSIASYSISDKVEQQQAQETQKPASVVTELPE